MTRFCPVGYMQGIQARRGAAALRVTCCCSSVCRLHCQLCWGQRSGKQQVHQLSKFSLLRVMSHLTSLSMTSGLRAHLHRQQLPDDRQANMRLENTTHTDDTDSYRQAQSCLLSNDVLTTSVVLHCSAPFPKHSKGIEQTPHAP